MCCWPCGRIGVQWRVAMEKKVGFVVQATAKTVLENEHYFGESGSFQCSMSDRHTLDWEMNGAPSLNEAI